VDHDPDFCVEAKAFRFLHVSSCFPRKGADVLLRAYGRAFSQKDSVTLIIKTFPNPHNEIHRWLKEAQAETLDFPDVLIIEKDLTEAELKSLYMNCQALVAPSRAEGYGLPLAEAMLTGIPVITTAWGGQLDFCHEENAWLVEYSFARSASHLGVFDSVWAEPDLNHLSEVLRDVYSAKDSTRKAKQAKAKRRLKAEHTWRSVGERMVAKARLWSESPVALNTPRIGWISTWNTRCGIATTSEHLVNEMKAKISILAPQPNGLVSSDGPDVCRCWNLGEEDTLESLANQIEAQALDTLVIQFNYGFFQLETLNSFLIQQAEAGRVILIVLHSTTDPVHVPHKRLSVLKAGLSMCDRILVHSIADLNRLKTLGLVDNVALFPLGILEVAEADPPSGLSGELVVSSYGFFLPHKGLLELIESIDILRKRGIPARLHMVNSEYPAPESQHIIQQAMNLISDRDLEPVVQLTTDFLSDYQSLAYLKASDLIVFPYQATGESASGAVRYGIASGRAVAVTPLPIFDDVEQAVWKLPGTTAAEIAEGIARYWQEKTESTPEVIEREIRTKLWRDAHGYSKLSRRLLNLATALRNQKRSNADGPLKRP
jgi:glycosyltransferase involved in cell wall biosynthesis